MLLKALQVGRGHVVSLVGGGGKTSLACRLVREAAASGLRAIFTVTTKILPPDLPPDLWVAGPVLEDGKLGGLSAGDVAALAGHYDLVVVEADGSRGRPLKLPAEHEPVIPPCTTVVVPVAGASVVGKPFHDDWVHRAALYPTAGPVVRPELVAEVLLGVATRGRPAGARVIPVINQADTFIEAAEAAGLALLAAGAPRVVLAAAREEPPVIRVLVREGA